MATNFKGKIIDLVSGSDYKLEREAKDILSTGQTLSRAYFTVKEEYWDTDADALFQKEITTTLVADQGHISDDGTTDLVGNVIFNLTDDETALLKPYFKYIYDIKLKTNDNKYYSLELGELTPLPQITEQE
jgi:hypothetical protein